MNRSTSNEYQPDYVSPPGETIQEILEAFGLFQKELAERTGHSEKTISQIVNGEAPITPETALQFERVLGVPASFWNNREAHYRAFLARQKERARLQKQLDWLKKIPLKAMIKLGWIESREDKVQQLREVLNFFGVASPERWRDTWLSDTRVAFRRSSAFQSNPGSVAAWLRKGEVDAQQINCAPYDKERFLNSLVRIRSLTVDRPEIFQQEMVRICAESGVALVLVRELPKTRTSGATRWLTPNKALIQLSLRYKSDDQLWFSFFHEAGHIVLHGKRDVFLEGSGIEDDKEQEANRFASNILIPPSEMKRFIRLGQLSKAAIRRFAKEIDIAPGIVVGRLQHDELLPHSHCNDLKRKLEWLHRDAE